MGVGGLLTAFLGSRTEKMISIFLSFSGGVMLSIVFFELVPKAAEYTTMGVAVLGVVIGALLIFALNYIMDRVTNPNKNKPKLHGSYTEFFHASEVIDRKKSRLRSGMILLFAIGLHNIPEGLALGAAGQHDMTLGFTLAIILGIHNIPEGMATSAPLISGGLARWKALVLTVLAGATTVIGAVVGVLIGGISEFALALSLSLAGGAMLYVVLGEILPQSIVTTKDRVPTLFALVGIVVGMLLTQI